MAQAADTSAYGSTVGSIIINPLDFPQWYQNYLKNTENGTVVGSVFGDYYRSPDTFHEDATRTFENLNPPLNIPNVSLPSLSGLKDGVVWFIVGLLALILIFRR